MCRAYKDCQVTQDHGESRVQQVYRATLGQQERIPLCLVLKDRKVTRVTLANKASRESQDLMGKREKQVHKGLRAYKASKVYQEQTQQFQAPREIKATQV